MNGYTKLFASILASTVWEESKETRVCWITMLAMADKFGVVSSSIPGLATLARLTIEETQQALETLQQPDEFSRTKDFDGRRIEPCDGGWLILNHGKYRAKANEDDRREYLAEAQRKCRERRRSTNVNNGQPRSTKSTQAEAEAEAEAEAVEPPKPPKGASMSPDEFITRWNRFVADKPKLTAAAKLTDKRRDKIRSRLSDPGWLDDFRSAIQMLPIGGDGWQPTIDWLTRNDHNIYLLLEGAFDWRNRDDPAMQKLAAARRRKAADERAKRLESEKRQAAQDSRASRNAIARILPQTNGSDDDDDGQSLLFGSADDSSANGAASHKSGGRKPSPSIASVSDESGP